MTTTIIIQARMSSTRLPGKILKHVLGKPLLEYQLERLRRVALADQLVVATTTNSADDPIIVFCQEQSIPCFRGSEKDVLARYYGAAKSFEADPIVRVTSDCPLIDPRVVDDVIRTYQDAQGRWDYVSNVLERTYPRGMDTEIFSFSALNRAFSEAHDPGEREHVTPYIYRHPADFRLTGVLARSNYSRHRWTVDTPDDFELIRRVIEALYPAKPHFDMDDVLDLLRAHPAWIEINAHIEQKKA